MRSLVRKRQAELSVGSTDVRASAVAVNAMEMLREHCPEARTVALFVSFGNEPPTDLLIAVLAERGVKVLLPAAAEKSQLQWRDYTGSWERDLLGIETPAKSAEHSLAEADVVFIPAIAASSDGRRLGRGAGYYDRALAQVPTHAEGGPLRIAVIDAAGLLPPGVIPLEAHDELVDAVLVG